MSTIPAQLRTMLDYDIDSSMAAGVIKFRIRKVHQTLNNLRASLQVPNSGHGGAPPPRATVHNLLEQKLLLKDLHVDVDKWHARWLGEKCMMNTLTLTSLLISS